MNNFNKSPSESNLGISVGISIITIIICLAINVAIFGSFGSKLATITNDYNNKITLLNCKIDSIDNSLKYEVKSKKDTIIIDVKPQIIKIKQPCYIDR